MSNKDWKEWTQSMQLALLFEHFKRVGKINAMWINPVDAWLHPWLYNQDPKMQSLQQALTGRMGVEGLGCVDENKDTKKRSIQPVPGQVIPGFIGREVTMTPPRNPGNFQFGFDSPLREYDDTSRGDLDGGIGHWDDAAVAAAATGIINLQSGAKSNTNEEVGQQIMVRNLMYVKYVDVPLAKSNQCTVNWLLSWGWMGVQLACECP
jgi:hypothetical protein